MATEEQVCKYHLSGFCKYKSTCKNLHVTDICLNKSCNSSKICLLRHPRMCKFYFNYGRCKFGSDCAYLHNHFMEDQSSDISLLQRDLVNVKNQIKKLEEICTKLDELERRVYSSSEIIPVSEQPIEFRVHELEQNLYILPHSIDDLESSTKDLDRGLENLKELMRQITSTGRTPNSFSHPNQGRLTGKQK